MMELKPINYKEEIVITTKVLANVYECEDGNIKKNFNINKDKFKEGVHYFKLEGEELKKFKEYDKVTNSNLVEKQAKCLYLWTKRGASRHCKMLGTDKAWEMFDSLEENYFNPKPQLTRKEELQLAILNGDDLEKISALQEYKTLVVDEATKPLIKTIETQKPKVSYHDKVLNVDKLVTTTDIAKDLGMTARELHNKLHDMKIIFKTGNHWTFYAKYQTRIPLFADYQITEHGQILKWTEKGRKWIIKLLNEQNEKDLKDGKYPTTTS